MSQLGQSRTKFDSGLLSRAQPRFGLRLWAAASAGGSVGPPPRRGGGEAVGCNKTGELLPCRAAVLRRQLGDVTLLHCLLHCYSAVRRERGGGGGGGQAGGRAGWLRGGQQATGVGNGRTRA